MSPNGVVIEGAIIKPFSEVLSPAATRVCAHQTFRNLRGNTDNSAHARPKNSTVRFQASNHKGCHTI
jgi:hypothetical protein